jgi:hypothetical protein
VIFGAGLGMCMQTLTLAAQNAVPARDMGVATSTSTSFRQLGGTLGVAIFFSVLFSTASGNITAALGDAARTATFQAALHDPAVLTDPMNKPVLSVLNGAGDSASGVLQNSSFLQHLDPRLAQPFFVGFSQSMALVFLLSAGIAAVAFALFLFMKELPLRQYSGLEETAMETAQALRTQTPTDSTPATYLGVEALLQRRIPAIIGREDPDELGGDLPRDPLQHGGIGEQGMWLRGRGGHGRLLASRARLVQGGVVLALLEAVVAVHCRRAASET